MARDPAPADDGGHTHTNQGRDDWRPNRVMIPPPARRVVVGSMPLQTPANLDILGSIRRVGVL